jgi:hypothetical protein
MQIRFVFWFCNTFYSVSRTEWSMLSWLFELFQIYFWQPVDGVWLSSPWIELLTIDNISFSILYIGMWINSNCLCFSPNRRIVRWMISFQRKGRDFYQISPFHSRFLFLDFPHNTKTLGFDGTGISLEVSIRILILNNKFRILLIQCLIFDLFNCTSHNTLYVDVNEVCLLKS